MNAKKLQTVLSKVTNEQASEIWAALSMHLENMEADMAEECEEEINLIRPVVEELDAVVASWAA